MHNILYMNTVSKNIFDMKVLFENKTDKYNLLTASSKNEFMDILNKNVIDLILLDIPDFQFLELMQKELIENILVIFMIDVKDKTNISFAFQHRVDYLMKPFNEYVFFTRITFHLELMKCHDKITIDNEFTQSVLDSQENMVLVHDKDNLLVANKSFYSFFNVSTVKEFNATYGSISSQFMEYENYFSLNQLNDEEPWLFELLNKKNTPYSILLLNHNTFEPETFMIDVNIINNSNKFVLTLTNITPIITQSKKYEMKATYDVLTNIYNRTKFNECIKDQYNLFIRYGGDLCLAIFDIDFFKKVNDNYGHIIGDKMLTSFAQTINKNIRNTDVFARWGGEEFTLLLPCTKLENALIAVENLRKLIAKTKFNSVGFKTCSIGLTQFQHKDTINDIFLRADEALYEAKETGRNKVCIK